MLGNAAATRVRRRLWWRRPLLLFFMLTVGSPLAKGEPNDAKTEAQRLTDLGAQALKRGENEQALKLFEAAYDKFPSSNLRYNLGVAYALLGKNQQAITAFHDFLTQSSSGPRQIRKFAQDSLVTLALKEGQVERALDVLRASMEEPLTPEERQAASLKIRELEARLRGRVPPQKESIAPPSVPGSAPHPLDHPKKRSLSPSVAWSITLGTLGLGAFAAGAGLLGDYGVLYNEREATLGQFQASHRALTERNAGIALTGIGAALAVSSVIVLVVRRHPAHRTELGLFGSGVMLSGIFQ